MHYQGAMSPNHDARNWLPQAMKNSPHPVIASVAKQSPASEGITSPPTAASNDKDGDG